MNGSDRFFLHPGQLRSIAADLERILSGQGPTPLELRDAPLLDNWRMVWRPIAGLSGLVSGHPYVGPGPIASSPLFAIDPEDQQWARTASRFYRLGSRSHSDA